MRGFDPWLVFRLARQPTWLVGFGCMIAGFAFHGCNALLLILALKDGELSILWPIYALSYVWVALLSMHFFGDRMNVWKGSGIALIILGVSLLGRASKRAEVLP